MEDRLLRKGLVVGIIFLFIGAGVYPVIAINNIMLTNENASDEFIKIPVQMFGLNVVKSYKKSITKQQYNELQILKEKFKEDFENTETMKKSVKIYRDMVVSLNELGLLPDGLSVRDVEKLVLGHYYYLDKLGLLSDKIIVDDSQQDIAGINENWFCLLTWDSSNWESYIYLPEELIGSIFRFFGIFFNKIAFGKNYHMPHEPPYKISVGWIHARSLQNGWRYSGSFWGGIGIERAYAFEEAIYYKGVDGFFAYYIDGYIFGYARRVVIKTL